MTEFIKVPVKLVFYIKPYRYLTGLIWLETQSTYEVLRWLWISYNITFCNFLYLTYYTEYYHWIHLVQYYTPWYYHSTIKHNIVCIVIPLYGYMQNDWTLWQRIYYLYIGVKSYIAQYSNVVWSTGKDSNIDQWSWHHG